MQSDLYNELKFEALISSTFPLCGNTIATTCLTKAFSVPVEFALRALGSLPQLLVAIGVLFNVFQRPICG